jgi:hypothetical protein
MPKLQVGKETAKFLPILDSDQSVSSRIFLNPRVVLATVVEAGSDPSDSSYQSDAVRTRVRTSQAQSNPVQPNPTTTSPPGKEIGKETVKFLAIFDHPPSCSVRKPKARFRHQTTAMGPLTPAAGTDTFPPGLSILTAAVIVQILPNLELSRLRIALTRAGTLSKSASGEFGTGTFFISSAIWLMRPMISLLQLARIFFTSAPQSTHNFSSDLLNFTKSASAIFLYPVLMVRTRAPRRNSVGTFAERQAHALYPNTDSKGKLA